MRVHFLGTNGWYSTFSNTICTLLETKEYYVIFDAGDGLYKVDSYIKSEKPIIIFLSHLHLDHIIGLHIFNKFRFKQGIKIYGYAGTKAGLDVIMRHPYTAPFKQVPFEIEIFEFKEGTYDNPISFTGKLLVHSDTCIGYRIELDNRIITYCTDTGVCDNMYALSKNSDLLISECSYKTGQEKWGWPHLKPEEAARVAKESNVKKLVLTHFDASIYKTMEDRKNAEEDAKKIFQNTKAAYDGYKYDL